MERITRNRTKRIEDVKYQTPAQVIGVLRELESEHLGGIAHARPLPWLLPMLIKAGLMDRLAELLGGRFFKRFDSPSRVAEPCCGGHALKTEALRCGEWSGQGGQLYLRIPHVGVFALTARGWVVRDNYLTHVAVAEQTRAVSVHRQEQRRVA